MVINHNVSSINTLNKLNANTKAAQTSLSKLSSGLKINSASDDAAGLAISQKMKAQINGLDTASSNAQNGISMIQTAEGALNETQTILQRMNTLAVQSANDTNQTTDRGQIQKEMDQLAQEVTRISNDTEFNSQQLINGAITDTGKGSSILQIGANAGQTLSISIGAMDAKTLGVSRDVSTGGTLTKADAGNVTSTINPASTAPGVINAGKISLTYSDGAATSGEFTATTKASTATLDLSTLDSGTTLSIKVASGTYTVDNATLKAATTDTALASAIDAAINAHGGSASINADGYLDIKDTSTGTTSQVTLSILNATPAKLATDSSTLDTALGISGASVNSAAGTAAGSASVTISSDGSGAPTATVNVAATDTSFDGTGKFAGLHVDLATGKTVADLKATDTITLTAGADSTPDNASAATFAYGITTDAVAHNGLDVSTQKAASSSITAINAAITTVSTQRAQLGAYENRLDHTINNLSTESQNLTSASSEITDVDMAAEMTNFTKNNILTQAAQAMLAQANQLPQGVLSLLK